MKETSVVLTGKVIYKMEYKPLFGAKRVRLQILLNNDEGYQKINKILWGHLNFIGSSKRSSAMPPCITYEAKKNDSLFVSEVGQTVEILFTAREYDFSEYCVGCRMDLPVIWPQLTAVKN